MRAGVAVNTSAAVPHFVPDSAAEISRLRRVSGAGSATFGKKLGYLLEPPGKGFCLIHDR